MRIILTGGTGFIGRNLIPQLLFDGHEIAMLQRRGSTSCALDNYKNQIEVYASDTYEEIANGFNRFHPEIVIHMATLYINHHTPADIPELISSNILLGTMLLEAMKNNSVSRILNFGTRWQHQENTIHNSANLYAATKEAFAEIVRYYSSNSIRYKTLELCDTFGKNDTRNKIVDLLIRACKKKEGLELSPGEQILDLVCVDDVVDFISTNITHESFYDNHTISISGTEIRLKDLGELVEDISEVSGYLLWGVRSYREHEVMSPPWYYPKKNICKRNLRESITKHYFANKNV